MSGKQVDEPSWDKLSRDEGQFALDMIDDLTGQNWAKPILNDIAQNGGVNNNKSKLFELRFAYALHGTGVSLSYEVAGEGESTLDFGFASGGREWLVELMRLEETQASRHGTRTVINQNGIRMQVRQLSSRSKDPRQSEAGDTLKAIERICQKCERSGRPHKFPSPSNAYHVLLVDVRTFASGCFDSSDAMHIALGAEYVDDFALQYWESQPISGAFSLNTKLRGAIYLRERVHFIGFVYEDVCNQEVFNFATTFVANPNLFRNLDAIRTALAAWPLQPVRLLNPL